MILKLAIIVWKIWE